MPPHNVENRVFAKALLARLDAAPMPEHALDRLRLARRIAVSRRRVSRSVLRVACDMLGAWGARQQSAGALAMVVSILAVGLYVSELPSSIEDSREVADIDAALLSDPLPPSAYLDPGFRAFLLQSEKADEPGNAG